MTIEIAERLVKLRKKYGYSQEELADKLGLSRQAVSKWERAEASPDTDNLICLAKLYGVSLDELLATDEDIDTIVKEQVKEEPKEDDKTEKVYSNSKSDRVVINNKGIHVQDKDGSTIDIGDAGVVRKDKDGNIKKVHLHNKQTAVIGAVEGALMLIAVAGYLLLGLLLGYWASGWIIFFIPEIICSFARAICKKDARKVNVPFIATFAFFFVCMFMPEVEPEFPKLWNPMWVVFLSIPIYYSVVGVFHKAMNKFQDEDVIVDKGDIDVSIEDENDDDEDEDDED